MADENKDKEVNKDPKPDDALKAAMAKIAEMETKLAELSKPKPDQDKDLGEKAREAREAKEAESKKTQQLEKALRFNLGSAEFLKANEQLLPKGAADIFKTAESQNYGSAVEKASAIKAEIVQSFFKVQSNLDLLTAGPRAALDEYLNLSKTGKQEQAQAIYESVFEPTFEMLKRMKKADALSKGVENENDWEIAYKNKLIALSRKHYLGEK